MSYLREFYVQVSQATGWRFNMSARSTLQSNRSSRSQTMRFRNLVALLFLISAVPGLLVGQTETVDVSGNWLMSADLFGTTVYLRMELKQTGASVTGQYTGDKITSYRQFSPTNQPVLTIAPGDTVHT